MVGLDNTKQSNKLIQKLPSNVKLKDVVEYHTGELIDVVDTDQEKFIQYERVFEYLTRAKYTLMKNIDPEEIRTYS